MEMKLIELLDRINNFANYVRVQNTYGELLTDYDGRNSIDVKYNDWDVYDFFINGDLVIIWIEEPKKQEVYKMKLTFNMLSKIEYLYDANRKWEITNNGLNPFGLGINIINSEISDGAVVCIKNTEICDLEDLGQLITELEIMRNTITECTGLY